LSYLLFSHNLMHQIYCDDKGDGKRRWDQINKIIILSYSQGREHYRPGLTADKKATTSRYEISRTASATTVRMYSSSLPISKLI
jgi:hypothetical protein